MRSHVSCLIDNKFDQSVSAISQLLKNYYICALGFVQDVGSMHDSVSHQSMWPIIANANCSIKYLLQKHLTAVYL